MPFDFSKAAIFPCRIGSKEPLTDNGFHDAKPGYPIPPGCNIGFVPASLGLVAIDLDPGHDTEWARANLPPTLTVKTPRGWHLYYKCDEQFGNGRLGPHIDVRNANGYTLLPPSKLADGRGYEWNELDEPVALPAHIRAMLQVQKRIEHQPLDNDSGNDNTSNLAKARTILKNMDPREDGWKIAVKLRRDIGLTHQGAVELFTEWSDTLDWPWDAEKIWSVCRNAGRYGKGDQGQYAGAGPKAYDPQHIAATPGDLAGQTQQLDNTARGWLQRELKPAEPMIGPINTQSRVMLVAPTGIGKTHVGMAVAVAVASGTGWLHWSCPQARTVLYIDGEMPRALLKERLIEALARVEENWEAMDNLVLVSTADYKETPSLNQNPTWVNELITKFDPALVIFDNIQALTNGDQKSGETWQSMLKWMRSLTDEGMAQLWIHHANEQGGMYGDKTRGWQLDTIIELERSSELGDISAAMKFTKHRELHPRLNRDAYRTGVISLRDDKWVFTDGVAVVKSIIEMALEGEYGLGILTSELVKRMIAVGDERSPAAIKKSLEAKRRPAELNRYVVPGISPVRWAITNYTVSPQPAS